MVNITALSDVWLSMYVELLTQRLAQLQRHIDRDSTHWNRFPTKGFIFEHGRVSAERDKAQAQINQRKSNGVWTK